MRGKKIIYILMLFLFFIIIGTLSVNATQEINTVEDMTFILGKENIEIKENEIKLLNDINLRDNLIIKNGTYTIDLNGKTISYTKNYEAAFGVKGGNFIIKDETNNGEIISERAISCHKGSLKIENAKITSSVSVSVYYEGNVQIDNGEFTGVVSIGAGNIIINGGLFKDGLEISFQEFYDKIPNLIINNGEFIGKGAGLYIWFSPYAKNVQLKGGTFKGYDEETPGIYVGGNKKFSLKELLPLGYKFDNDEQNIEEQIFDYGEISYHTTSANEVSVERYLNRNIIKLTFVDFDGNIIETKNILQGRNFTLPEAPKKEGYVFIGWDIDSETVTNDMVVTPIYEKIYNFEVIYIYDEYYTGEEIKPNVIVIDENTENRLSEKDYEIICDNNINVGTANVLIQGKGKYKYCTQMSEFKILPKNINYEYKLNYEKEYVYTGEAIEPNLSLIYKNVELTKGVDYEVYYESNVNVGAGKIVVEGIGNYTGKKTEYFRINQKQIDEIIVNETNFVYTGNEIFPEVIVKVGNKELIKDVDYTIYYGNNIDVGTGYIRINATGNYTGYETIEFNIISKDINNTNINVDLSNKQYIGRYIRPTVEVFDGSYKLRENYNYTVKYSNNLNIGKATIMIIGKNGYSGTVTETFNIVPKEIEIESIKTPIFRTVKLTWQKDSTIDGYEIYRANDEEGNYSLVKSINKNNKDSHLFLAHKKGTFYYTIRSYKIVDGEKIYSDFSEFKEIKVR